MKIYERVKEIYIFLKECTTKSIKTLFTFKKSVARDSYFLFKILDKIKGLTLIKL